MAETTAPRCPHLSACELFPKFALRASLKVWIVFYCESKFEQCARYGLALANRPVPMNLLPNGRELKLARPGS
jgi:hypothetical protein